MAEAVQHILHRALKANGLGRRLPRRIPAHVWAQAVGPQIARRAQPTVLSAGILHVLVEDYRWRDQLDAARRFVIERINARLGREVVRELQFGLAHTGALSACETIAQYTKHSTEALVEPERVLGTSRLPFALREALLRAAEAAQRRAARA